MYYVIKPVRSTYEDDRPVWSNRVIREEILYKMLNLLQLIHIWGTRIVMSKIKISQPNLKALQAWKEKL